MATGRHRYTKYGKINRFKTNITKKLKKRVVRRMRRMFLDGDLSFPLHMNFSGQLEMLRERIHRALMTEFFHHHPIRDGKGEFLLGENITFTPRVNWINPRKESDEENINE